MTVHPQLVGPKPEPEPPTPKFQAPFHRVGYVIKDRNNKTLISSDNGSTLGEDRDIADVVVAALNAYYSMTESSGPETVRYIIDRDGDIWFQVKGDKYVMSFAEKYGAPNLDQYESSRNRAAGALPDALTRDQVVMRYGAVSSEGTYEISQ